jgi:hypothetical protein
MPLEITLNATRRKYLLAFSRNSMFLIEERHELYTDGTEACERWSYWIVGASAHYGNWILNQRCAAPELGEPLYIQTTDPNNDLIITTKLRKLQLCP